MKHALICTIMRNQERNISRYFDLLNKLMARCALQGYMFDVSIFENDSTDGTVGMAEMNASFHNFSPSWFTFRSEKLGTQQYGSIWSVERIKNLALYRQKCLEGYDLSKYDKIVYIEPDVTYDPIWCQELITAKHPEQAGVRPHIYSGWSLRSLKNPKESTYLYDTCATRQLDTENCWNFEKQDLWKGHTLIKTHISDIDSNCLHALWSTFNCFCVYDAEPFKKGLKWSHINKRFDTGQQKLDGGWLDSDTVVICEDFRAMGYPNILINTNCLVRHE